MIIIANTGTMYVVLYKITMESDNVSNIAYPMVINIYLTYVTLGVLFSFFETVSYTMMVCLAVDLDLSNVNQAEFGPAIFHINMNVVKRQNKKSGGFVAPKVERDLKMVGSQSQIKNSDGEDEEPDFVIDGQAMSEERQGTGYGSDHENLF